MKYNNTGGSRICDHSYSKLQVNSHCSYYISFDVNSFWNLSRVMWSFSYQTHNPMINATIKKIDQCLGQDFDRSRMQISLQSIYEHDTPWLHSSPPVYLISYMYL